MVSHDKKPREEKKKEAWLPPPPPARAPLNHMSALVYNPT